MFKKGQIVWNNLIPWIIGIIVLILTLLLYFLLSERGKAALTFIKNSTGLS